MAVAVPLLQAQISTFLKAKKNRLSRAVFFGIAVSSRFARSRKDHLTGFIFTKVDVHGNSFLSNSPVNTGQNVSVRAPFGGRLS
uniref:Uncharacterized protein n=1 Tax=Pseudomonas putida TaxID=303 RepID=Q8VMP1_PSEPU|nr:hypothetical protein [Pseudomonas putida]